MAKTEWVDLPRLTDYQGPIDELIKLLTNYKKQYGSKAVVRLSNSTPGYRKSCVQLEQRVKTELKQDKTDGKQPQ